MRKERWFFVIPIFILISLIFLGPGAGSWFRGFLDGGFVYDGPRLSEAILENEVLRAEVYRLEALNEQSSAGLNTVTASVFSKYPFNFKNEILINVGENRAVGPGQPVVFLGESGFSLRGLLLGKIDRVFSDSSLVRTIFDKEWQSSVRIGKKGYLALLQGGGEPVIRLIPKDAKISVGDVVYSVQPEFPNSLPVGEVLEIGLSSDQVFQEAKLSFPYDFSSIKAVAVLTNND
ncbi:MAG: rod shape-determining protein MreC [Patescibacteria group bacterium]